MDIIEQMYEIEHLLNKNSNLFSEFHTIHKTGYDFQISFKYYYKDPITEEEVNIHIENLYYTKALNIEINYSSLEEVNKLISSVSFEVLFEIEKKIHNFNELPSEQKSSKMYILKANHSKSVLMEKKTKYHTYYLLRNISPEIEEEYRFLFTLSQIKQIESNPNIIFDCYIVELSEVLEKTNNENIKVSYPFTESEVINPLLFEKDISVDYYNTVLMIRDLIKNKIDSFNNEVLYADNYIILNKRIIIQFYEEHIAYDLSHIADVSLQKELLSILQTYNNSTHKVFTKYAVIHLHEDYFLQTKRTPVGELYVLPLESQNIQDFDESCVFYLEEINEKFSEELLDQIYKEDSVYKIILWESVPDYQQKLFKGVTDSRFRTIINNLNSISKRVV